jgi:hypothetical protein
MLVVAAARGSAASINGSRVFAGRARARADTSAKEEERKKNLQEGCASLSRAQCAGNNGYNGE